MKASIYAYFMSRQGLLR